MKRLSACLAFLLALNCAAQVDSIQHRIFLVGDAGELHGDTHPVIEWLRANVNWDDERNAVLFLGDNIYPYGLPMKGEEGYDYYKKILDYQLSIVKGKKAQAIFVPGNHDWYNGKSGGWQRVVNQVNYINGLGEKNIQALPLGGCPGPILVDLSEKVAFALIDSHWFLHVHDKPGPGSSCISRTVDEFSTELREIMATRKNQLLVVAMHHPLYSFGPHGGAFTWMDHIFPFRALNKSLFIPLPLIGSIYPVSRGVFGSLQDTKHPLYQTMIEVVESAMRQHPNTIHVAGHDHNLQMIMKDSLYFIVSGSAAKLNRIEEKPPVRLLYSDVDYGFATIEIRKSGKSETKFYNLQSRSLDDHKYSLALKKIDTATQTASAPTLVQAPELPEWVTVPANPQLSAGELKKALLGHNYREEWTTPVRVKVLDLGKELGGLTPEKQGGGKQTRTLRVEDSSGKEWSLRSVQKFPDAAIPPDLRQTVFRGLVEDGISASHPYASLSIPVLAKAAGVPYLNRRLVYIPDDPRLGRFRENFKDRLVTMEEREPSGISKTDNTDEVALKLAKDNDWHVDHKAVLTARLLDNFYMDFDRHEDQWRWATFDTGKGKIYYPIPRDQDQAFFVKEGLIPRWVNGFNIIPELQGFKAKADNIKTFNRPARNFDRFFLTELDEQDWEKAIDTFLSRMTDTVIEQAINMQPPETRNFHGPEMIQKLKDRRKYFREEMMTYYRFLAREVTITGTDQRELVTIDKQDGGRVRVTLNKINKSGEVSTKFYDRTFNPSVTKELRIFALAENDSIIMRGGATPIRIRIIGGPGDDNFRNESRGNDALLYDATFENNKIEGAFRKRLSNTPKANEYVRQYFKYDSYVPGISAAWNVDDGLYLGAKMEIEKQGFRKEPNAMRQYLRVQHALRTKSWRLQYEADYNKVIGATDFLVRADIRAPINVTNFFGFGNNTVFNKSQSKGDLYYRARYNYADASFLFSKQLQSWMRINYGPALQYFHLEPEQNVGKFIVQDQLQRQDSASLFGRKWYAGAEASLHLNSRNNDVLPTRGLVMDISAKPLFGVSENTNRLMQVKWDMNVAASFGPKAVSVFAFRFGYGATIGAFEYPQAQYLSGPDNLRGYRRNRFAGRSMLYQNTEVRLRLLEFNTYLFPGSLGMHVFHDIGRVWMDNENSRRWHNSVGAGLWVSPIKRFVLTGSLVHSQEERLMPYFTFGFQF